MVPEATAPVRCERCREEVAAGSRFCSHCGAAISVYAVERRQLTVLFFDLVGYTTLAHQLDPEEVQRIMRAFDACGAAVLQRRGGHIARYAGDGSLAYFGFPRAHEDDAEQAVHAGLELVGAVARLDTGRAPRLRARVGIATGEVVVGEVYRHDVASEVTAHGEALPLASRLQAMGEADSVIISETTRRLVAGHFECRSLGLHALTGFPEPLRIWRVLSPSDAEGRFAARAARIAPLVGREAELRHMEQSFAAAAGGEARLVVVAGEAGIGKSRLVAALRESVADSAITHYHQCSTEYQTSAFHPLLEKVAREARFAPEVDPEAKRAALARFVAATGLDPARYGAVLAEMLSLPSGDRDPTSSLQITPDRLRRDFSEFVVNRVLAAAQSKPVLLIFEDAHWMDSSTMELVRALCGRLAGARVLAVLTSRTALDLPQGGIPIEIVALGRLGRDDCARLAASVGADAAIGPAVLDSILDRADGVPLFVEELLRSAIDLEGGGSGGSGSGSVPLTLRDSLVARLDRLAVARGVVRTAAALGRAFSHELLAAVTPLDAEALRRSLEELGRSGIVLRDPDLEEPTYAFRHALLRDAAYDLILREERVRLHARIATTLEARFPETVRLRPEEVAHHFSQAQDWPRSVEYWLRAGARAAARSSFVEAIAHLRRGHQQVERLPAGPERDAFGRRFLLALGEAHAGAEGFASKAAGEYYVQALERSREGGEADQLLRARTGLFGFHSMGGRFQEALEVALGFHARARSGERPVDRMVSERLLGVVKFMMGDLQASLRHLEAALALYEQLAPETRTSAMINAQDQKSTALAYLALALGVSGDPPRALATSELGIAHSEGLGHLHSIGYSLTFATGLAAILQAVPAHYGPLAARTMDFARAQEFPNWRMARVFFGFSRVQQGALEEGLGEMREGLSSYGATGGVVFAPTGLNLLGRALGLAGRPAEALCAFDEALEVGRRTGERWGLADVLGCKAEALVALERREEAALLLEEAIEEARSVGARLFELRAATGLARLQRTRAGALLEPLVSVLEAGGSFRELVAAREVLAGRR